MVWVQDGGGLPRAGAVGTVRSQVLDVGFEGKKDIKGARVTPASGVLSSYWLR